MKLVFKDLPSTYEKLLVTEMRKTELSNIISHLTCFQYTLMTHTVYLTFSFRLWNQLCLHVKQTWLKRLLPN